MSSSLRVLDFFVVEANEYIDQIDSVLGAAGAGAPDAAALGAAARRLRGSATMARQPAIAGVAAGIERIGRALGDRTVGWSHGLSAALVAAVDDLRLLVRGVRSWGASEEQRARAREQELSRIVPASAARTTPGSLTPANGSGFLSAEASDVARALDQLAAGGDRRLVDTVTERVRALRGVADVRDMPPLPEVLEAVENTLKSVELAAPGSAATTRQVALFAAAAALLRRAARDIAARGRPVANVTELPAFEAALNALADEAAQADRIVPVTQLFHEDGGPHVVSTAPNPPTTPAERFRLEVVSLAEHLRAVVGDARAHTGPEHRDRIAREMRAALRALGSTATSFGEKLVARFAAEWSVHTSSLGETALAALDSAGALLATPASSTVELARGLERFSAPRAVGSVSRPNLQAIPAPARPTPPAFTAPAPPARGRVRTPTGPDLRAFLEDGISALGSLDQRPLSPPTPIPGEEIVPIQQLLYRGRSALARAAELRAELARQGGTPAPEAVQELFDLIDLALVE